MASLTIVVSACLCSLGFGGRVGAPSRGCGEGALIVNSIQFYGKGRVRKCLKKDDVFIEVSALNADTTSICPLRVALVARYALSDLHLLIRCQMTYVLDSNSDMLWSLLSRFWCQQRPSPTCTSIVDTTFL